MDLSHAMHVPEREAAFRIDETALDLAPAFESLRIMATNLRPLRAEFLAQARAARAENDAQSNEQALRRMERLLGELERFNALTRPFLDHANATVPDVTKQPLFATLRPTFTQLPPTSKPRLSVSPLPADVVNVQVALVYLDEVIKAARSDEELLQDANERPELQGFPPALQLMLARRLRIDNTRALILDLRVICRSMLHARDQATAIVTSQQRTKRALLRRFFSARGATLT